MIKKSYFRQNTEEKWEQVRNHPYYERVRTEAVAKGEELLTKEPLALKFSDYHKYVTEGTRKPHQRTAGVFSERMNTFFFCYMLTGDEKYIEPLVDAMWQICDRETWASPAHVREEAPILERRRFLDLGSCSMGYKMAEILYHVGDKFPELARRRIEAEIRFRIIDCYREKRGEKDYWWYKGTNNWSAVCISMVFGAFIYLATDEEIEAEIPRMLATAQCFIDGMPDDGCCLEGNSYWNYGFSHYCVFADFMREYTGGKIDLFKNEKVHRIAQFQSLVAINSHQCLSFSDAGLTYEPSAWLSHFIHSVYPDCPVPATNPPRFSSRWLQETLWCNPDYVGQPNVPKSHIFEDAQWFLYVGEKYALGAKAGKNKEPHNHNDVGSFLISKNDEITFVDPGTGEYVKDYFGSNRYTLLMPSARSHSVPVINGHLQCISEEKADVLCALENRFTFTCERGYPAECRETLASFVRDLNCTNDALILTDRFSFTECPTSLVEQFVSLKEIKGEGGELFCGDSRLTYNPELFDIEFSEENFTRNNGTVETLYTVRLSAKELSCEMTLEFKFD